MHILPNQQQVPFGLDTSIDLGDQNSIEFPYLQ